MDNPLAMTVEMQTKKAGSMLRKILVAIRALIVSFLYLSLMWQIVLF